MFNILVGVALLLFGRRLFWLFVAGAGFVAGLALASQWFGGKPDVLEFVLALLVGLFGALLSIFMQRLLISVAGFLAGGYILGVLAFAVNQASLNWVAFLVGGVIGAILVSVLFDWALIVLSALTGATVIIENVPLSQSTSALLFVGLLVLGLIAQAWQPRPPPARSSSPPSR